MSEQNSNVNRPFKEEICIEAMRVFDSCCFQECLEDLKFEFECCEQEIINEASFVKTKCLEITDVSFVIDPVPFNKGFYTVDVQYHIKAEIEAYSSSHCPPKILFGEGCFSKKVILFGSDGNTQRFVSDEKQHCMKPAPKSGCAACCDSATLPTASVNAAPLMCLDTKLVCKKGCEPEKEVLITFGIFAIIQLSRPVPVMIPSFEYCMPEKECSTNTDTPCELFDKIKFPVSEFFPKGLDDPKPCCHKLDEENDESPTDS